MTALRSSGRGRGVHSDAPLEVCCPHCGKQSSHKLSGQAFEDRNGKGLEVWVTAPPAAAPAPSLIDAPQHDPLLKYGIARPDSEWRQRSDTPPLPADPLPDFGGER